MIPTKDIVACVKHWPVNYNTYKKSHRVLVDPLSTFSTPKSFAFQSLDAPPRKHERSHLDYEYRLSVTQP